MLHLKSSSDAHIIDLTSILSHFLFIIHEPVFLLSITLPHFLSFEPHINKIVAQASQSTDTLFEFSELMACMEIHCVTSPVPRWWLNLYMICRRGGAISLMPAIWDYKKLFKNCKSRALCLGISRRYQLCVILQTPLRPLCFKVYWIMKTILCTPLLPSIKYTGHDVRQQYFSPFLFYIFYFPEYEFNAFVFVCVTVLMDV